MRFSHHSSDIKIFSKGFHVKVSGRDLQYLILQDLKREREDIPENNIASLQEELAASKLREAESNLALKDLRSKVADLNTMWQKHLKVPSLILLISSRSKEGSFPRQSRG